MLKLIGVFVDNLQPELAQARLARAREFAGNDPCRLGGIDTLREPHYRVQCSNSLIEFDNLGQPRPLGVARL